MPDGRLKHATAYSTHPSTIHNRARIARMTPSQRTLHANRTKEYQAIWQLLQRVSRKTEYREAPCSTTQRIILENSVQALMEKRRKLNKPMCGTSEARMIDNFLERQSSQRVLAQRGGDAVTLPSLKGIAVDPSPNCSSDPQGPYDYEEEVDPADIAALKGDYYEAEETVSSPGSSASIGSLTAELASVRAELAIAREELATVRARVAALEDMSLGYNHDKSGEQVYMRDTPVSNDVLSPGGSDDGAYYAAGGCGIGGEGFFTEVPPATMMQYAQGGWPAYWTAHQVMQQMKGEEYGGAEGEGRQA